MSEPGRPPANRVLRLFTWPLSALLILFTVFAGHEIIVHTPGSEEAGRSFVQSGQMGQPIDTRTFRITGLSVQGAPTMQDKDDETYTSDGVFVVVRVRASALAQATVLYNAKLLDSSGRQFTYTRRLDQPLVGLYRIQPAIPIEGDIVFEVPRDARSGLTLWVTSDGGLHNYESVAQIDLGVDPTTVDKWRTNSQPVHVDQAKVAA